MVNAIKSQWSMTMSLSLGEDVVNVLQLSSSSEWNGGGDA
jgi:hypothetical protein